MVAQHGSEHLEKWSKAQGGVGGDKVEMRDGPFCEGQRLCMGVGGSLWVLGAQWVGVVSSVKGVGAC